MKKIAVFLFMLVVGLLGDTLVTAKSSLVRVAVLRDADHFTLTVNGRCHIVDDLTGEKLSTEIRLRPTIVKLENGAIKVGERTYNRKRILIEPRRDAMMSVNKNHYRGTVTIINTAGRSLTVVNSIGLEEYIRGVLYHEISDKWPMEAIKAQAVATRTYAVYSMQKYAGREYDMTSDVYSQVYGGRSAERYRTNLGVKRTAGEVLTYNGKIIPAFFHANSGGATEDAGELWNIKLSPLKGVDSPYSVGAPHYQWVKNFRLKDIQDKLASAGFQIGLIEEIKVVERNRSGRVRKLEIRDRDGLVKNIEGRKFREALGPNVLKSNKYDIEMKGWYVDFIGQGWGHGVGMCQWGAYNMAKQHIGYREILDFYYPGSRIEQFQDAE